MMLPETPANPPSKSGEHPESDTSKGGLRDASSNTDIGAREFGGREGPEPTRFGDWEKNGRCIDF